MEIIALHAFLRAGPQAYGALQLLFALHLELRSACHSSVHAISITFKIFFDPLLRHSFCGIAWKAMTWEFGFSGCWSGFSCCTSLGRELRLRLSVQSGCFDDWTTAAVPCFFVWSIFVFGHVFILLIIVPSAKTLPCILHWPGIARWFGLDWCKHDSNSWAIIDLIIVTLFVLDWCNCNEARLSAVSLLMDGFGIFPSLLGTTYAGCLVRYIVWLFVLQFLQRWLEVQGSVSDHLFCEINLLFCLWLVWDFW